MHGQQSFFGRFFIKIIIQKRFKLRQKLMASTFSGYELSFIETFGIIQQQFNLRQNNFLSMLVDVLTFFINFIQNFKQVIFLIFRKMQSFIHGVREKSVRRNCTCQRLFQKKIFVKYDQKSFVVTIHRLKVKILNLIWRGKTQNPFVIIVMLLAISHFSGCIPLQCNTVKSVGKARPNLIFYESTLRHINHAHHRMFRFRKRQ